MNLPLVIDSTIPEVIEIALKHHGGRCVINSVNLEDGGKRLRKVAKLAKDFGAMLICLSIDEEGMAKTATRKLSIALRIKDILEREFGFKESDLIFDPLTFTVGSGDAELRNSENICWLMILMEWSLWEKTRSKVVPTSLIFVLPTSDEQKLLI